MEDPDEQKLWLQQNYQVLTEITSLPPLLNEFFLKTGETVSSHSVQCGF